MNKELKNIVVVYHGDCLDGFGGAFAAWKKFGESAAYLPAHDREKPEWNLAGKEVYIIDFSYPKEVLLDIEKQAKRLVILDHHISVKEAVESVREHIFDNDHSGVGIAWQYFHPEIPMPKLLAYVQDGDLWKHSLPNWQEIGAYLSTISLTFETWDNLANGFEKEETFNPYVDIGKIYSEYFNFVCKKIVEQAEMVEFEGYRTLSTNAPGIFKSAVGNLMAKKYPPISIIWSRKNGLWHFSLRGDDSVDVSEIAKKYGGGGNRSTAAFRLPATDPLPFKYISN